MTSDEDSKPSWMKLAPEKEREFSERMTVGRSACEALSLRIGPPVVQFLRYQDASNGGEYLAERYANDEQLQKAVEKATRFALRTAAESTDPLAESGRRLYAELKNLFGKKLPPKFWAASERFWIGFDDNDLLDIIASDVAQETALLESLTAAGAVVKPLVSHGMTVVRTVQQYLQRSGRETASLREMENQAFPKLCRLVWDSNPNRGRLDQLAYRALVTHFTDLWRKRKRTNPRNGDLELYKETFWAAAIARGNAPSVEEVYELIGWDKQKALGGTTLRLAPPNDALLEDVNSESVEDSVAHAELASKLETALPLLAPGLLRVIVEIYALGHSIAETARNLDVSPTTVRRRREKAIHWLRAAMGDHGSSAGST